MKKKLTCVAMIVGLILTGGIMMGADGCSGTTSKPVSDAGVRKVTATVPTDAKGRTVEQKNILERLKRDNQAGSIKHLYVVSAFSGDVLIYSTVKGKVTSSGKRLTSTQTLVKGDGGQHWADFVMPAIQDDGTYGHSVNYLYWFDSKGVYHQHYVAGGQIVHISDQPLAVPKVIINMEQTR